MSLLTCPAVHPWLRRGIGVAFVPGLSMTAMLEEVVERLLARFRARGDVIQSAPDHQTDLLLTTAPFAEPLGWRQSLLLTARRRFRLSRTPTVVTLVHATRRKFRYFLDHFRQALSRPEPDPVDFAFPGLAPEAWRVLVEQGRRGGPLLALERMVQAQAKCLRVLLFVGDESPQVAYAFDLVGAYPCCRAPEPDQFYDDLILRMVTAVSVEAVTHHTPVEPPIARPVWEALETPAAMAEAARELSHRDFFTEMVRIADLVHVPAVSDAVAKQYSEGCFATWDPHLGALVTTVTGSARPVDKRQVTEDDLAVIVGVRPDRKGAFYRPVEGKRNDPPSSEALEMFAMDGPLPQIRWETPEGITEVPVARSKLHGHRGIAAYDPRYVEYVPVAYSYQCYPVSCGTSAQAEGIVEAFSRAESLRNPDDPRAVAFTILPGHGVFLVEKWLPGKAPFQAIWEFIDAGYLQIDRFVPQGPLEYLPDPMGRMHVQAEDPLEWLQE
ncbi:MAG: hypothetical protein RML46_03760 [Anaerolineae bacterium]|nr:hypothetical protein [Anaerolineae bacterium]MDW8068008.1 hypothetical protein [Anaerolineae bacterium]